MPSACRAQRLLPVEGIVLVQDQPVAQGCPMAAVRALFTTCRPVRVKV